MKEVIIFVLVVGFLVSTTLVVVLWDKIKRQERLLNRAKEKCPRCNSVR